jgi:hypothetical protein
MSRSEVLEQALKSKSAIAVLQEFVQGSASVPLQPKRPVLQWTFATRKNISFRATVAFLLDGIPHHAAGTWQRTKKVAQRDTAERALSFFVGQSSKHFSLKELNISSLSRPWHDGRVTRDTRDIEAFKTCCAEVEGVSDPRWQFHWDEHRCQARLHVHLLGTEHQFLGGTEESEQAAQANTSRRVLWYLQYPGFRDAFEVDTKPLTAGSQEPLATGIDWGGDPADDPHDTKINAEAGSPGRSSPQSQATLVTGCWVFG